MAENKNPIEWRVIGETVPGASHLRAGIPNQDNILFVRESSRSLPIILCIADGHGSPKCFRSDRGSRYVVKKSAYLLSEFLDERRGRFDTAEIESQKDYLSAELVRRWREAVEADLKKEPFTEKEFENLEKKADAKTRKLVEDNPLLAYGTTSLTVAMEEDFVVYWQLGDGDILNISETGEVTKPLSEDPRLLANETTSMCLPKAENDFRFFVQKISADESGDDFAFDRRLLKFVFERSRIFPSRNGYFRNAPHRNGFRRCHDNLKRGSKKRRRWAAATTAPSPSFTAQTH
jgi:serine/threonine protein phosphatase PrpC